MHVALPTLVCPRCGLAVDGAARFCPGCGAPLRAAGAGHELRKTVTVVFCDISGSTALGERLDAEALRHVLGRYYAEMRSVLERHGGLVEKFIGDAVVAVFGVPEVHEDDALRAARAALEMRSALDRLNAELDRERGVRVGIRIGVNTGDVVAGDLGPGASFASGDAVNVAARLEQSAHAGEILIGHRTRALLGQAVAAEPVSPLELHGKAEPVDAFRLLSVADDAQAIGRRVDGAFVGRERELAELRRAFADAVAEPACRLVTVLGEPGIGKTRLLTEFAESLADDARVVTGHCLPYGEGITYRPLAEIVLELGGEDPAAFLADCLSAQDRGDVVRELVLGAVGKSDRPALTEEIQWAMRRLFEALAAEQPLVVVLEDLHWAEPTFLQLVEYVAGCSTGFPVLLLAAARDELLESRPGWALPRQNSRLLPLRALDAADAEALIDALDAGLSESFRRRVARAGGGNPLFLEQLLALHAENGGDGELPLPPTIKALLAARLDRLPTPERDALERGAVEGVTFTRESVAALLPAAERGDVGPSLLAAVRRNLIRPQLAAGGEGYGFVHVLVRNAVYGAMPKELRARLHERLASRLDTEQSELVGYHLEQASKLLAELAPPDEHVQGLARRASALLAAEGRAANLRGDVHAAANLLDRASALLSSGDRGLPELLFDLADAYEEMDELRHALELVVRAGENAAAVAVERLIALAHVREAYLRIQVDPGFSVEAALAEANRAAAVLERLGDDEGLARALGTAAWLAANLAHHDRIDELFRRAVNLAHEVGNRYLESWILVNWMGVIVGGVGSVTEGSAFVESVLDGAEDMPRVRMYALAFLPLLRALQGRFDEARGLLAQARATAEEYGRANCLGWLPRIEAEVELRAGNVRAAAAKARLTQGAVCDVGARAGSLLCLGEALYRQGRLGQACGALAEAAELTPDDDVWFQAWRRSVLAKVKAAEGDDATVEELVREAAALTAGQDRVWAADVLCDLAEALSLAGRREDAAPYVERAVALYDRKEATYPAAKARELLAELTRAR